MGENDPPGAAGSASTDVSRGMPYYEKLRRDLRDTLQKKRVLDQSLAQLEDNILRTETSYLEETSAGNIIKGFDNYIKGSTTISGSAAGGAGASTRRKIAINDVDRIFSRSSASSMRDQSAPNSATTTPSHAQTPTSSFPTRENSQPTPNGPPGKAAGASSKKKKALEKDDEDTDGKPAKRSKITYGRD